MTSRLLMIVDNLVTIFRENRLRYTDEVGAATGTSVNTRLRP